jgi:hypothetical protein
MGVEMILMLFLAVTLLASLSAGSEAGPPWFATTGKLTRIGTGWVSEGLYLTLDVDTANNSCNAKNTLFMERDHPQYRETLSIALLSLGQARLLDVYHDGSCWGDAVKLFAVSIRTNP